MEKNAARKLHQRLLSFTTKEVFGFLIMNVSKFLSKFGLPGGLQTFIILIIRLFYSDTLIFTLYSGFKIPIHATKPGVSV